MTSPSIFFSGGLSGASLRDPSIPFRADTTAWLSASDGGDGAGAGGAGAAGATEDAADAVETGAAATGLAGIDIDIPVALAPLPSLIPRTPAPGERTAAPPGPCIAMPLLPTP